MEDTSSRHSLRVHAAPTESARDRYPLRVRDDAAPRGIRARTSESAVERKDAAAGVDRRLRLGGSVRTEAPRSLRATSAPGSVRVVDKAYVPESLESMMETEEAVRGSGVLHRAERAALRKTMDAQALKELKTRGGFGMESHRLETLDRDSVLGTEHVETRHGVDAEEMRRELRHRAAEEHVAAAGAPMQTRSLRAVPEIRDDAVAQEAGVERASASLRAEDRVSRLSRVGTAYRSESLTGRARTGQVAAGSETAVLRASARVNESIGTANTFVVLSVENTGQTTAASPVVRLALPAGVRYEGLAFAPPGTVAAVVETQTGRAVEVVLPMRVPSGHESRVMVYLSPRDAVRTGELKVEAFPQGQATVRGRFKSEALKVPAEVERAVTSGESRDP